MLIFFIAAFSSLVYLFTSSAGNRVGFPLDDAWIHQTYARNFALGEGWSFRSGELSGGATAPLWTFLMSIGYLLKLSPLLWAFGVGIGFLAGIGVLGVKYFQNINPSLGWLGLFLVFEWHFTWASVSGMETILAIFTVIVILYSLNLGKFDGVLVLALASCVWIRPDLLSLLIPVMVGVLLRRQANLGLGSRSLVLIVSIVFSLITYAFFNQKVSGSWFPTTFYAKQAEYAELRQIPFVSRYWQQFSMSLVGSGALVLIGFIVRAYQGWQKRDWLTLSWFGWYLLVLGIYAARLPVTYQHGRYVMPAMVVYYLYGIEGSSMIYTWLMKQKKWGWILAKTGLLSWLIIAVMFWFLGARAYAKDVLLIETQMVAVAKWAQDHLPPNSQLAVHDIGAIGYFTDHNILDLAGLINPEVIPIIRDEPALAEYLDRREVDYLICFPLWYPYLTENLQVVYQADPSIVEMYNEQPMTIFRWRLNNFISLWIE